MKLYKQMTMLLSKLFKLNFFEYNFYNLLIAKAKHDKI